MKNLSFKQKFFIVLSVAIFLFSTVFSAYYGLTNSRIESINSAFKVRPYSAQYFADGTQQIQERKIALGEEYIQEGNQNIDLGKITLITPYYTSLQMLGDSELKANDFVGYFNTTQEIKINLPDFEITLAPEVLGIIDTLESKIIILGGLVDFNNQILEANQILNYKDQSITDLDRSTLSSQTYIKVVESVSKFKSDTISEIDVTAPELVSINLDSLHQTIEGQIVISGEARGAAKIFVNNFEVNDRSGEKFSLRQSLKLGENFIDLVLVDEVGNSFTKRYVVNRINEPEPISFPN